VYRSVRERATWSGSLSEIERNERQIAENIPIVIGAASPIAVPRENASLFAARDARNRSVIGTAGWW
jgi:hypothetical protein